MAVRRRSRLALALLVGGLSFACRGSAPPAAPPGALPVARGPRVVLLSLDGAAALDFERLLRAGELRQGFARFVAQGRVARLVPVDPTLTSPNHISLATGFMPGETGIVSNLFRRLGQPITEAISGFAAPIETETLWEAARRQGKRVGVTGWPGCDGQGPRRTADWGMLWAGDHGPLARSKAVVLTLADWRATGEPPPSGARSFSPPLRAHLALPARSGPGSVEIADLVAVDRSDDGRRDYDALWVVAPYGPPVLLEPERWASARLAGAGAPPRAAALKLQSITADLAQVRLWVGAPFEIAAYPADFARRIAERGLAWPEEPDDAALEAAERGRPGIDLDTWVEEAERSAHFFVDAMLVGAQAESWDLLMGYVPVIDEAGHALLLADPRQPGFTAERRQRFAAARERVWRAVDGELGRLLDGLDLARTTVVVVSDHGMAPVHTSVDPNALLLEGGWLAVDAARGSLIPERLQAWAQSSGETSHVYLNLRGRDPGGIVDAADAPRLLEAIRAKLLGFAVDGEAVFQRVLTNREAAERGFGGPNAGDLVAVAAPGFRVRTDRQPGQAARPTEVLGQHGFPNDMPEMLAIYLELGPGVPAARLPPIANPAVAGRVAARLGISPPERRVPGASNP